MQLSINNEENISKMFKQFVEDCKNIKLTKTTFKTVNQVWAFDPSHHNIPIC